MNYSKLFIEGRSGDFSGSSIYKVSGSDREKYFQGQTTNDIVSMKNNSFQINSRVDRTGKIQFYFLLLKNEENLFLIFNNDIAEDSIAEFEKFIIMDEVEISKLDDKFYFSMGTRPEQETCFSYFLFGLPAYIYSNSISLKASTITTNEIDELSAFLGWPRNGIDVNTSQLINETRLGDLSVSYDKGCFLGQETVAKIHHGRGASYSTVRMNTPKNSSLEPGTFSINDRKGGEVLSVHVGYCVVRVFREFRIENKNFEVIQGDIQENISFSFYLPDYNIEDFSHQLYLKSVELFQDGDESAAIEYLESVIELTPNFADAYESLGVIYGRQEKFEKGIELMDKLLSVDDDSVLAHTNKSLYLMNLGKIEEAEEEKGLATVKSFAMFGKEAKDKRAQADLDKENQEQLVQRESMFKQVLEIDREDTIANFGMGDIFFQRKEFQSAKSHLELVISVDPKYSMAYLLLGKTLEVLNDKTKAKEIYEVGIGVASSKGELMPANEMQSRLVKLTKSL